MPDLTTREVLCAYLADPLTVLRERDRELRGEAVHQLRVAARQARSVLASYEPLFEPGAAEPVRKELRWLGRSLGSARDTQVLLRHLLAVVDEGLDERLDPPSATGMRAIRGWIEHDLREAYTAGRHAAVEAVASTRYERLVSSLEVVVRSPALRPDPSTRAAVALPAILERDARSVWRAAGAARQADAGPARGEALHDVRKKVKRLRYSAESAVPVLGKGAKRLAQRAKSLQEPLGTHQDTLASRAWLESLAGRADTEPTAASVARRLHAREGHRARSAERDYEKAMRRLTQQHVERWLHGEAADA